MDEDTHDDGSIGLSVATIGNIVRSEIERGLAPVEQKLNHIHNILDERIDKIESTVGEQGLRIDKLEQLVMHAEGTPRSHVSERSVSAGKPNQRFAITSGRLANIGAEHPAGLYANYGNRRPGCVAITAGGHDMVDN